MNGNKPYITQRALKIFAWVIISLGALLRIAYYVQNRNLFIDEANVARNIYERSFKALTLPLSYDQYAPPIFLWILKCCTLVGGYSEFAFRIFPLLCGIATLILLLAVLKKYNTGYTAVWYPLLIIASGFIYIRYSVEIKQYMCDAMVALSLLLIALNIDITQKRKLSFFLVWCVVGTITIWLSMPGVFILAGIGCYYAFISIKHKDYHRLLIVCGVGLLWLVQFYIYYSTILKPQIQSNFLQTGHKDFFPFLLPNTAGKIAYNIEVLTQVLTAVGGKWTLSIFFHLAMLITGGVYLVRRHMAKAILLLIPLLCLLIAAILHQYALTPRLIIFIMPVMLIMISVGLEQLLHKRIIAVNVALIGVAAICIINYNSFDLLYKRRDAEQITESFQFLQQQKIPGRDLLVHDLAAPAYIYYTTINPRKDQWKDLAGATLLHWNTNYDSLAQSFHTRKAFVYSWAPEGDIPHQCAIMKRYHKEVLENIVTGGKVYVYDN